MITSLALRNFKSWGDTGSIEFGPITAFFGSNSSGKTSILQSLLLLKQTTESADRGRVFDFGGGQSALVNLGTFRDITFKHESNREVGISVAWCEEESFQITDPEFKAGSVIQESRDLRLSVEVTEARSSPVVRKLEYEVGDSSFELYRRGEKDEYGLRSNNYTFRRVPGRAWPLPPPGKFYSFPDQVRGYFQNASFLTDIELQFEKFCGQIFYLGPLRQDPDRQYIWSGGRPADVGRRGQLTIDALIASKDEGNVNSRGFGSNRRLKRISVERNIAEWLKELGLIHSFLVEPVDDRKTLYRVAVQRSPSSPVVLLTDVGFGVSQVLPVLVLLAYVPSGSTVLLEQPEIHLHPAVQSGLADVIIETAKARNVQVVIESHSEHLLLRLQRRIAEKNLERGIQLLPDDCKFYFCDAANGSSKISMLGMDEFGNIKNWPIDFFGDSFGESVAMTRAAQQRAK